MSWASKSGPATVYVVSNHRKVSFFVCVPSRWGVGGGVVEKGNIGWRRLEGGTGPNGCSRCTSINLLYALRPLQINSRPDASGLIVWQRAGGVPALAVWTDGPTDGRSSSRSDLQRAPILSRSAKPRRVAEQTKEHTGKSAGRLESATRVVV